MHRQKMFKSRDESGSDTLPQNEQEDAFCMTRLAGEVDTGSGQWAKHSLGQTPPSGNEQ